MANKRGTPQNLKPAWKPGESPNPGGKPKGSRNRLTGAFVNALADDFEEHGKKAIAACRAETPHRYIATIAALCPKQIEIDKPLDQMGDDELATAIAIIRQLVAGNAAEDAGKRGGEATGGEQASKVRAVH